MPDIAPEITESTRMVLPAQTNHHGTLFAGSALSMLADAAFTAASRHAREKVVLAGVRDMRFTAPIPVGSLFGISAQVISSGRSSMIVRVTGTREHPETGETAQVVEGRFQMVAVTADGRPKKIHPQETRP
ncbi:Acyl-CoA hydrolase [Paracoccus isoporae]|uniref:Acyl-CoA hydrolase n=1 Tax=Paracoccus isoporae TaxID=591205 RepID=A0A1G6SXR9_9RHOB|nr:hotdog domain-containing protein [Paracoccus isoporae]SDD21541.1 Acyl-CoA hydrolase [Paracoccus isoporae]